MAQDDDRYLELLTRISEQQKETTECVNKLDKKLDLNIQKVEYELKNIHNLDEIQNRMLDEHMKRSDALEQLHLELKRAHGERLKTLEEPRLILKRISAVILTFGALATAVYSIATLLGWL